MKKFIVQTTLALTALVTGFLPQKAEAGCGAQCFFGDCYGDEAVECGCTWYGAPYCNPP